MAVFIIFFHFKTTNAKYNHCVIIEQDPLNYLLSTRSYEVEMGVEEILISISHQIY